METMRLLLVDDEPAILSALRRTFRNHQIETACDGATGLEAFRRFRPSVVVSDCRMPGMSGVEFFAKARAIDPEPVRVMLTGYTELSVAEAAINEGEVWRFVTKPWSEEELRATIAQAHERYRTVTENRVLVDKLAAIGSLAAGVAHDMNNPLGGILAYCGLLKGEVDPGTALAADLTQIEEAALRVKRIVTELLDFSRTAKTGELSPTTLASVAEKAVALSRFQFRDVQVRVESEGSTAVLADANRLQQVVLNLLTNAHDAVSTPAGAHGGTITVRTWQEGSEARLAVTDDGPGVSPAARSRLFDPFFTTKAPGEGTGLGLAVSLGIVREHGGRIELVPPSDTGATFVVSLPLHV